jgi:hypothetical protein
MSQPLSDFRSQSVTPGPSADEPIDTSENPDGASGVPEVEADAAPAVSPLESQIAVLLAQGKNGANWFYRIAGYSVVNTLIMVVSGGIYFVLGLGVTFIADEIAQVNAGQNPRAAIAFKAMAFGFSIFMSLVFCGFGWMAGKRYQPLFLLGMALYLLDGLLFVLLGQILAAAFHAYALYGMWGGFQAYRRLAALERKLMDPLHPAGELNPLQAAPVEAQ